MRVSSDGEHKVTEIKLQGETVNRTPIKKGIASKSSDISGATMGAFLK